MADDKAIRDALAEALRSTTSPCNCDDIWTGRGLHAPECIWDEADIDADNLLAREPLASLLRVAEAADGIRAMWFDQLADANTREFGLAMQVIRDALAALPKEADR